MKVRKEAIFVFLGILIGFLLALAFAGKSAGVQGLLPSIIIPIGNISIHLHHWLWASVLSIGLIFYSRFKPKIRETRGFYFIIGLLFGFIIQGLTYRDWYVIFN